MTYHYSGLSKLETGDTEGACKDLSKALELGWERARYSFEKHCN